MNKKNKASLAISNEIYEKLETVDRDIASLYSSAYSENANSTVRDSRNPERLKPRNMENSKISMMDLRLITSHKFYRSYRQSFTKKPISRILSSL
jgi:hypothetical protein